MAQGAWNQVKRAYNGLGQLVAEWQAHARAVDPASTPAVGYAYSEMAGGANHSRLTAVTSPDGSVVGYGYAAGPDDSISRLSAPSASGGMLETYSYLGLGTRVARGRGCGLNTKPAGS